MGGIIQFAYVVSHDLKAPLRAINNLTTWIMEDMPELDDDIANNFNLLKGRVSRMENLINGVLAYSKIGRAEVSYENISIYKLVNEIKDLVNTEKKIDCIVRKNLPEIYSSRLLLEQVFSNLISNAIKYNDKEVSKIEIGCIDFPTYHEFYVTDNGPGIAPQYQDKIFKIFQTIEARDKRESTGIGLSIVQKIMEELKGKIWIESDGVSGSTFKFILSKKRTLKTNYHENTRTKTRNSQKGI